MALVKVIANNIFAGASLQKQEPGSTIEVTDSVAEHWIKAGLAEVVEQEPEKKPRKSKE